MIDKEFSTIRQKINNKNKQESDNRILYNKYKEYKNFILDNVFYTDDNEQSKNLLNKIKYITDFQTLFDKTGKKLINELKPSINSSYNNFYDNIINNINLVDNLLSEHINNNILSSKKNEDIYENCKININNNQEKCNRIYKTLIEPKKNIPKKFSYCYINEYLKLFIDPSNKLTEDIINKINFKIENSNDKYELNNILKNLQFNTSYNINILISILSETIKLNYIEFKENIKKINPKITDNNIDIQFRIKYENALNRFINMIKKKELHNYYKPIPNIEDVLTIFLKINENIINYSKNYENSSKEKLILDKIIKYISNLCLLTIYYYQSEHCYYLYNNIFEKFKNIESSDFFKNELDNSQKKELLSLINTYNVNRIEQNNYHNENFFMFLNIYMYLINNIDL